jgi:pre-60S factor REI1
MPPTGQSSSSNITSLTPKEAMQVFTCNTCSVIFGSSEEQRSICENHGSEIYPSLTAPIFDRLTIEFSVYNIKRRVASLPAITLELYQEEVAKPSASSSSTYDTKDTVPPEDSISNDSSSTEDESSNPFAATDCLFCHTTSLSVPDNLTHMLTAHGLFIPEADHVADLPTFLRYLTTVITRYHECLYCGAERGSTEGVLQHMRDRGHCMVNFEREPELLEFWEFGNSDDSDGDGEEEGEEKEEEEEKGQRRNEAKSWSERLQTSTKLSESEMQLPSGVVIGSRSEALHSRPGLIAKRRSAIKKAHLKAITAAGEENVPSEEQSGASERTSQAQQGVGDRRVAKRGELGLIGVPEQQRRALLVTEKKMQKREAVAKAAYSWVTERIANKQKHYRVSNSNGPLGILLTSSKAAGPSRPLG